MKEHKNPRRSRRLASCYTCQHHQELPLAGITCGTPLVGNTIDHNGQQVELCGCVMQIKTALPSATCPIARW